MDICYSFTQKLLHWFVWKIPLNYHACGASGKSCSFIQVSWYALIADSQEWMSVNTCLNWRIISGGLLSARDVTAGQGEGGLRLRQLPATLLTYLQTAINASSGGDVSPAPRPQVTAQKKRKTLGLSDVGQIYDVRIVPATPHDAGRHRTTPDDRCRSLTDNVNSSNIAQWHTCTRLDSKSWWFEDTFIRPVLKYQYVVFSINYIPFHYLQV